MKPWNQPKKKKKVKSLNEAPKKEMNTASWLTVVWFKPPPVSFPYGDFVALSNSIAVTSYKGHLENTVSSFDEIVTGHLRLTWKKEVDACICRNNMFKAWYIKGFW